MIAHISIGNSDNKLTQYKWANFCTEVETFLRSNYPIILGAWYSLPNSPYQNACWGIKTDDTVFLEATLARLARDYNQGSIAVAYSEGTKFIGPE